MATWDEVHRIAMALPQVGTRDAEQRQWRVGDKLFAWERALRPKEIALWGEGAPTGTPILAARVPDLGAKEALLADDPSVYFTIPHFNGYPAILVHLDNIPVDELEELLTEAWLSRAPKRLAKEFITNRQA
jgi:hypothetical protein